MRWCLKRIPPLVSHGAWPRPKTLASQGKGLTANPFKTPLRCSPALASAPSYEVKDFQATSIHSLGSPWFRPLGSRVFLVLSNWAWVGDWQQAEPTFPRPLCCSWLNIRGTGRGPGIPGTPGHSCFIVPGGGAGLLLLPLTPGWEHSFLLIHHRECFGPSWGGAGALGGHLRHEQSGVDRRPWQQGEHDLAITQGSLRSTWPQALIALRLSTALVCTSASPGQTRKIPPSICPPAPCLAHRRKSIKVC